MGSRLEGARGRWAGKAGGRANRCPSEAANTVSRESKPLGAGGAKGRHFADLRAGRFHQEMVELHAAWTQAARVEATAGRAAAAAAEAEAEAAAEAAAEEEELLLGCI